MPNIRNVLPASHPRRAELENTVRTTLQDLGEPLLSVTIGDPSRPMTDDDPVPVTIAIGGRVVGASVRPFDDSGRVVFLIRSLIR